MLLLRKVLRLPNISVFIENSKFVKKLLYEPMLSILNVLPLHAMHRAADYAVTRCLSICQRRPVFC